MKPHFEEFDKLTKEINGLIDECERKSFGFAVVCRADDGRGGVKRLKQNIKSLKRIKADILKYIKELDKLTARYK